MGGIIGALLVIGASSLSGLLSLGTYGHFKDKKRWSSWKAGAASGAITGSLAAVAVLLGYGAGAALSGVGQLTPGRRPRRGVKGYAGQFGALVVNKLYGCSAC